MYSRFSSGINAIVNGANALSSLLDLFIRLWMANIFWSSGLVKIGNFDKTLDIFTTVFKVPLFNPTLAAVLATGTELIGAVLLVLGLATRFASASLIFLTFMAAISYHLDVPDAASTWGEGYLSHIYFGILLTVLMLHGPGKLSLDHYLWRRYSTHGN
ncbi:MAG: DoxX family protein [Gammaproteobacteria bacterium]|nr:DoxX family protein [Gammaproteobacteria bacterium]